VRPSNLDSIESFGHVLTFARDHTLETGLLDRERLDKHRRVAESLTALRIRFEQEHARESGWV
jgi:hypothetical protein